MQLRLTLHLMLRLRGGTQIFVKTLTMVDISRLKQSVSVLTFAVREAFHSSRDRGLIPATCCVSAMRFVHFENVFLEHACVLQCGNVRPEVRWRAVSQSLQRQEAELVDLRLAALSPRGRVRPTKVGVAADGLRICLCSPRAGCRQRVPDPLEL